jgi:predicted pyridoxine 5'-phosphate oxidase superfamily flavin-nucleotide-binding protein
MATTVTKELSMNPQTRYPSDVAFTPTVKALQARYGSRHAYARMEQDHGWSSALTPEIAGFVAAQTSIFFATANGDGQPYIQHRGGPAGFLHVLDDRTIAFADFSGNRQYVTLGNLADNPRAYLFLIDYARRRRVKLWGRARAVDDDPELIAALMPPGYAARAERAIVFTVDAWDVNCPKHIPQRFDAADVEAALATRDARIRELEDEVARLTGRPAAAEDSVRLVGETR